MDTVKTYMVTVRAENAPLDGEVRVLGVPLSTSPASVVWYLRRFLVLGDAEVWFEELLQDSPPFASLPRREEYSPVDEKGRRRT